MAEDRPPGLRITVTSAETGETVIVPTEPPRINPETASLVASIVTQVVAPAVSGLAEAGTALVRAIVDLPSQLQQAVLQAAGAAGMAGRR